MAYDPNYASRQGTNSPALGAFVIVPSDTADLPKMIRAVTLPNGGSLRYVSGENDVCVTGNLPAGTYPLFAKKIYASGTTAADMTGWV